MQTQIMIYVEPVPQDIQVKMDYFVTYDAMLYVSKFTTSNLCLLI